MKKILKFIVLITGLVVIFLISYFLLNRTIKLKQHTEFKKIYNSKYTELNSSFLNITGEEIGTLNLDKLNEILNLLKEEEIRPVKSYEYDKIMLGKSYRLLLKSGTNQVRIIISHNTITIGKKVYWISEKSIDSLNNILSEYSEYYF